MEKKAKKKTTLFHLVALHVALNYLKKLLRREKATKRFLQKLFGNQKKRHSQP